MSNFGTIPYAGRLLMVLAVLHLAAGWFAGLPELVLALVAVLAGLVLQRGARWAGWCVLLVLVLAMGARAGALSLPPVPFWLDAGVLVLDGLTALSLFVALWRPAPAAQG